VPSPNALRPACILAGVKPLIIGFGNPMRTDDGLGWHAAQFLRGRFSTEQAQVIAAYQLAPEMARAVADASVVIFIDAEQGATPGRVTARAVQPRAEAPRTFTHHLSPAALIACARLLFQKMPPAHLVTVSASEFCPGESLTKPVAAAVDEVARQVDRILAGSTPELDRRDRRN
jgi:hydrogenase maturation protease